MALWKFASLIETDKEYKIKGMNIWNFDWHCTDRKVEVVEPTEREIYVFKEYTIANDSQIIHFVAGEYSNGKMGIYLKEETEKII
jgi:hypothetical protein